MSQSPSQSSSPSPSELPSGEQTDPSPSTPTEGVAARPGAYRLGVDLGTTFTAAAVSDGGPPTMVGLGNRALQVPSVLFLADDGEFLIGEAAERRGVAQPERLVREFKRRIGDHVPLLVAGSPYSPQALAARLLRWVLDTATERMGGPPSSVVLTHPANWGPYKLELLRQVGTLADLDQVETCPEPQAAAAQYAARNRVDPGQRLAVYDLGGGTFDVCVLEQTSGGFRLLGSPEGIEQLGGVDFDEALFQQVMASLGGAVFDLDPEDPGVTVGLARLRRDCVEAKEALSTDVDEVVPVTLPGLNTSVRVTRSEFESLIRPALRDTVAATNRALRSAGTTPDQLAAIVLVGGSSRIPLVGELLQREFGVPTALDTHPKHDIAMGSLLARVDTAATTASPVPASPVQPVSEPGSSIPAPVPAADESTPADQEAAAEAPVERTEPITEQVPEPITEPISGPTTDPITEPITEPIADPIRESAPVADPTDGTASPSGEPDEDDAVGGDDSGTDRQGFGARLPVRLLIVVGVALVVLAATVVVAVNLLRDDDPNALPPLASAPPAVQSTGPVATPTAPKQSSAEQSAPAGRQLPVSRPLTDTEMIVTMEIDGVSALYLADTEKPAPVRRLTNDAGGAGSIMISPDRRTILYLSAAEPDGRRDYWFAAAATGDADRARLGKRPAQCAGSYFRGAWNPVDPTMIAVPCTDRDGDYGLHLMRTDGTVIESIPIGDRMRADDPSFSADGKSLVFWLGDEEAPGGSLVVAPIGGDGDLRRLTPKSSRDADPVFSPDGETIAFRRRIDGNSDIYTMPADGSGQPVAIITTEADDQDPSWSPDGSRLIYKGNADSGLPGRETSRIWIADADGSDQQLLWTEGAPGKQNASSWSRR